MTSNLIHLLLLSVLCFAFWQQRRQSEIAKRHITRHCSNLELQLLSVSFGHHKWKTPDKGWRWHTIYYFEFSALGDDCYQGELMMVGFHPFKIQLPPYRI
ncbi:DUF3301 domain-containing protein [Vibrio cincinnatiensis]|uniref:DUF3301 domain-containing protein n=2 Tax=Vibrio cincinnatiensis TaxID=675 RepID=A0A1T4RWA9_VIBCI|nr:DUF3301 domain-containing protein [Vibrio cincinnatiensis]MCG3723337.1 DUF3301 domain-containing protein [Vibrio cincinnatiensis]MCG3725878.1 DUF3301 domain-containing protein [Vibrio cincinnatiensis]MCG3732885.1 DUF3301 domain-containing protein [Vibrio cincinnatiensis]MCG3736855.1 DUF3301 domain-containing protein [Vibrio cincinnatiensis]MCG3740376.1 DUF3301 domain-containing protein [Vibrio cincinnatiensis]